MITNVPQWEVKTPREILDYLASPVSVNSNRGRLTHTWIAEHAGLDIADKIYAVVNAVSVPTAMRYAAGNGIDTSALLWKMQATEVANRDATLAPHLTLLRDFELTTMPRWQQLGYTSAPTLESITADQYGLFKQQLLEKIRIRLDTAFNQIGTTEQSQAITELRLLADDLEAQ